MSDFAQSGLISTFQQLNEAHLPALETELTELARTRPNVLSFPIMNHACFSWAAISMKPPASLPSWNSCRPVPVRAL
ncbi:MAG: hypothetical protein V4710_20625, partial [Verrucomicrobiota bacterium]